MRPRSEGVLALPEGVQRVAKRNGRIYYYWAPGRSSKNPGPRVRLPDDPNRPEFWTALDRLRSPKPGGPVKWTFSALIAEYRSSGEWDGHRPATRRDYGIYLDRLETSAGDRLVRAMTKADIYRMRDDMADTPAAANHMISILRALIEWGVARGYRQDNPAIGVKRFRLDEDGATPWPEVAYAYVMEKAPENIRRMAYLGRATGQRVSDLVRMRGVDLIADGINTKIGKLRDKKHFVPLVREQVTEIASWRVSDLDRFITYPTGKAISPNNLRRIWSEWRDEQEALQGMTLKIHGLRATAIFDRRLIGLSNGEISDEIGLSVGMVERYLRHSDREASARASRDRRERKKDVV